MPSDPTYLPPSGPQPGAASSRGGLPARWPSAWPSMASAVVLRLTAPLAALVVLIVVLVLTQTLAIAWWFALIPLAMIAWALSLPARVRKAVRDADQARTLDTVPSADGTFVEVRHRRLGVRPSAELNGRAVRYRLEAGKRAPRTR